MGRQLVSNLIDHGHSVTIATRGKAQDNFGNSVQRLVVDRGDPSRLLSAIGDSEYDIVFDQICYAPNDAFVAVEVFKNRVQNYVFTSSMAVNRDSNEAWVEEGFDPYRYPVRRGNRSDFDYAEGKRLAEAVFYQHATFDVAAVRFPVVLGLDDYSKRVEFHIERIQKGIPIGFPNLQAKTSLINDRESGNFLHWVAENRWVGPINACSEGVITWRDFFSVLEEHLERTAIIVTQAGEDDVSPYSESASRYMDTRKAKEAGYTFETLEDWLPNMMKGYGNDSLNVGL